MRPGLVVLEIKVCQDCQELSCWPVCAPSESNSRFERTKHFDRHNTAFRWAYDSSMQMGVNLPSLAVLDRFVWRMQQTDSVRVRCG